MTFPAPGTGLTTIMNGGVSATRTTNIPKCSLNDLIIVFNAAGSNAGASTWNTTPTGWTKFLDRSDGVGTRAGIWLKKSDGTESPTGTGTVNFTTTSNTGAYAAIAYVIPAATWTGNLADVVISSVTTNTNPPNPASFTSGLGSVDTTWFAYGVSGGNDTSFAAPSGYTGLLSPASPTPNGGPQVSAAWKQTTAASEDPGGFTGWTTTTNQAWVIAIKGGITSQAIFMAAGGDEGGLGVTPTGSAAVDSSLHHSGANSIKYDSTGSNAIATTGYTGAFLTTGGYCSAWFYITNMPSSDTVLMNLGSTFIRVVLTSGGVLKLFTNTGGTQIGSNGSTVTTGNWFHLEFGAAYGGTANYTVTLFYNGVSDITATNSTALTGAPSGTVTIGWGVAPGASKVLNVDDIVTLGNLDCVSYGNLVVTTKRPNANGTTNDFTTQIGSSGSGYGSGHSPQVNEVPSSATNGWSLAISGVAKTEEYNIENLSTGSANITGKSIVGIYGWIRGLASSGTPTENVIIDGETYAKTFSTAAGQFGNASSKLTYPAGTGTDIGILTSTTSITVSLYECGVMVAYIDAGTPALSTPDLLAIVLTAFAPVVTPTTNTRAIPAKLSLSLSEFAPALAFNTGAVPSKLSLITSRFAPSPNIPGFATPGVKALTLTELAPAARVPALSTISRLDLNLTEFELVSAINTIITNGALVTSGKSPSIFTPQAFTPNVGSLSLTGFIPRAAHGTFYIPGVKALTTTRFNPQINLGVEPTPAPASLSITRLAPAVKLGIKTVIGKLSLVTAKFAPFLLGPKTTVPDTLELSLNSLPLALHPGPNVSPDLLALSLTGFAPVLTFYVTPKPATKALTLTSFRPLAKIPRTATPATRLLVISSKLPRANVGVNTSPSTLALVTARFAPSPRGGVTVETLGLNLTEYAPHVVNGAILTVGRQQLLITSYNPQPIGTSIVTGTLGLILSFFAPFIPRPLRALPTPVRVRTVSDNTYTVHGRGSTLTLRHGLQSGVRYDQVVTPGVRHLLTTMFGVDVIIGVTVTPDTGILVITRYPLATASIVGPETINPATLTLTPLSVGSFATAITPNTKTLLLSAFAPNIS